MNTMIATILAAMTRNKPRRTYAIDRKRPRVAVQLGTYVKICPGGNHAWYDSNVGLIRKPFVR